jgi:hypothetical protein
MVGLSARPARLTYLAIAGESLHAPVCAGLVNVAPSSVSPRDRDQAAIALNYVKGFFVELELLAET